MVLNSRINYKLGGQNKKAILPTFVKLDPQNGNLLLSSNPIFEPRENHVTLELVENDATLKLDLFITLPYQSVSSDTPSRSISDLIDAELKSKIKEEPKKDKKDKSKQKKNSVD